MKTLKESLFSRRNIISQLFKLSDDFRFEIIQNDHDQAVFIGNDKYNVKLSKYHSNILYNRMLKKTGVEIMDEYESINSLYYHDKTFEIRDINEITLLKINVIISKLKDLIKWFEQNDLI